MNRKAKTTMPTSPTTTDTPDPTVELCKSVAPCGWCNATGRGGFNAPCTQCLGTGSLVSLSGLAAVRRFEEAVRERCAKECDALAEERAEMEAKAKRLNMPEFEAVQSQFKQCYRIAAARIRQPAKGPNDE